MQCSEKGCKREVKARNLCGYHYWKKRQSGELKKLARNELNQDKRNGEWYACSACGKEFYRRASETIHSQGNGFYCSLACWYKRNRDLRCTVKGCNNSVRSNGLCAKHYSRWRRHGDPNILKHEPNGSPNIKSYRKKRVGNRVMMEHQWVAEQALGRRLRKGENLHHKNGDRLNNKPDNLILFKTMPAHRQYENRYREYLEMCIREGYLTWTKTSPQFEGGGVELATLLE